MNPNVFPHTPKTPSPWTTHSSSFQSDPWIRWSLHSTGTSSSRLFSGAGSSWVKACASISQSSGLPVPEAGARPIPPALPPTLGHVWVSLCEAGGKKKRKSPHHTYSQTAKLCSQPICFSNHCSKKMACLLIRVWPISQLPDSALHILGHRTDGPVPCFCKL